MILILKNMKKGDKIIWDSGFGYEVGFFIGEGNDKMYNSYRINLVTGSVEGDSLRSKDEVIPYGKEEIKLMFNKYGYIKKY